ncbi:NUDIX domain-containing protein [Kribbella sp. NBC_00709]|uniref:NUDIX domain-containing protein n=1 Tax=Kribbella sp. NBC_00709 TaxID=2975972 RepID=UPI003FA5EC28
MPVPVPTAVLNAAGQLRRIWWKVRRPTTYGVKALLIHPLDPSQCLVVQHSYVDRGWWGLPGGGYHPRRETAEAAAIREVAEELALTISECPVVLDTVTSRLEGKVDNLTIVVARPTSEAFQLSAELAQARWTSADPAAFPSDARVSRWLRRALEANQQMNQT